MTGNKEIDLINAVLTGDAPVGDHNFFKAYLDGMNIEGPYNFGAGLNGFAITNHSPNGWGSEHRWTWSSEINGGEEVGIFNGLDYLLFHNLLLHLCTY